MGLYQCLVRLLIVTLCIGEGCVAQSNSFVNPPNAVNNPDFSTNDVYNLGDPMTVTWTTNYTNVNLTIWQDITGAGDGDIANFLTQNSFQWVVNIPQSWGMYPVNGEQYPGSDHYGNVFYFAIYYEPGQAFTSHYFNISNTTVAAASSSPTSSITSSFTSATSTLATSPTSSPNASPAMTTSSSSAAPSATQTGHGLTESAKVGLGVGLGVGVSCLLIGLGLGLLLWRKMSQRKSAWAPPSELPYSPGQPNSTRVSNTMPEKPSDNGVGGAYPSELSGHGRPNELEGETPFRNR